MGADIILKELYNIEKKIEAEVLSIHAGKEFAKEFYNTVRGSGYNQTGVKADQGADAVCSAVVDLCDEQAAIKEQLRRDEWAHLMEYRRLMELKLYCNRAFASMSDLTVDILQERAVYNKSWAEIAKKRNYSESQVKRIYRDSLARFLAEYSLAFVG